MDEPAIRMWAWEQVQKFCVVGKDVDGNDLPTGHAVRMEWADDLAAWTMSGHLPSEQSTVPLCSFCGKPANEVSVLVAGPDNAFICNECINTSAEVVAGQKTGE